MSATYSQRRQAEIPRRGLRPVVVRARDLAGDKRGRLMRDVANGRPVLVACGVAGVSTPRAPDPFVQLPPGHLRSNMKNYREPPVIQLVLREAPPLDGRTIASTIRDQRGEVLREHHAGPITGIAWDLDLRRACGFG